MTKIKVKNKGLGKDTPWKYWTKEKLLYHVKYNLRQKALLGESYAMIKRILHLENNKIMGEIHKFTSSANYSSRRQKI